MRFSDVLNGFIDQIGCSAKELSDVSHVSPAVISRYRSGERIPNVDGPQLQAIAAGIEELSRLYSDTVLLQNDVMKMFTEAITGIRVSYEAFLANLNQLVDELGISNNELARALSFDPSYISRILGGQRHPADMPQFVAVVSNYVARRYSTGIHATTLSRITSFDPSVSTNEASYAHAIAQWLGSNVESSADSITDFLQKLDAFDLRTFSAAAQFQGPEPAATPALRESCRVYTTFDQMMQAELDFLAVAANGNAGDEVIMYSDMPFADMANNLEFSRKWAAGMLVLLKKGMRMRIIHDVNRPFYEMMLGLENWIPLYMTGQVSPYYLHNSQGDVFCHLLRSAGNVALAGEAIAGHQVSGRYVLLQGDEDVRYSRDRAQHLLQRAVPLMSIYRRDDREAFLNFMKHEPERPGNLRMLLSAPPVGIASADLLTRILARNGVSAAQARKVMAYAEAQRASLATCLDSRVVQMEIPMPSQEDMAEHPVTLPLAGAFLEEDILYSYDEYQEHLQQTMAFAEAHETCSLQIAKLTVFRNIQIIVHGIDHVLVSKNRAPAIHFVIRHPNMVVAFDSFVPGER